MRSLPQQVVRPRCPRCGEGKLFASPLKISPTCGHCQLDLSKQDAGDGPTFFVILIVGFLIMAGASVVEYHFAPPLWLHGLLWVPLTFIACVALLRTFKALLITLEYRLELLRKDASHE